MYTNGFESNENKLQSASMQNSNVRRIPPSLVHSPQRIIKIPPPSSPDRCKRRKEREREKARGGDSRRMG